MNYSQSTQYHAVEISPNRWHVIKPSGIPIYDGSRNGDDAPVLFDEDSAFDYVQRMNDNPDDE